MELVILIPPSEGKTKNGSGTALTSVAPITKELLSQMRVADPKKLYGLKDKALQETLLGNATVLSSPTLPAIERYTGVVYSAIEYTTLNHKDLFNKRIRIVSGLFGLVAPLDPLPWYRLKIDKLSAATRWLPENSKQLSGKFVIDLLPQAHKKAVTYGEGIAVEFVFVKNGKKMPAGHQGKYIKGRFVRWLIEQDITSIDRFSEFSEEGYVWTGNYFLKEN